MQEFDQRYFEMHRKIQEDTGIVRVLFERAKNTPERYAPATSMDGIYLGVDTNPHHMPNNNFQDILAKMRLLYEVARGSVDLSRVYLKLHGVQAIVSEDMTANRQLAIRDPASITSLDMGLLEEVFDDSQLQLQRSTFDIVIGDQIVRSPIVDLDHLPVREGLRPRYCQYFAQYSHDQRFVLVPR
ncbi:hypothetical protein GOV09_05025 [Candidatus Woesearchaeota archaeon]|nr:hypothetical protein [Candidatus Woesearchaeota archaeon]